MSVAIAELPPEPEGPSLELAPARPIELPPAEVMPEAVRPAAAVYTYGSSETRGQLVAAVDRAGHEWERAIAVRALEVRAELVEACHRVAALHAELVELRAAARWVQRFPWRASWEPEPYRLEVGGKLFDVVELLGAIADVCMPSERLIRIASRPGPHEDPYAPASPALEALREGGVTLREVRERLPGRPASSSVHRWLSGKGHMPPELPGVLEQLVGAGEASRILALVPSLDAKASGHEPRGGPMAVGHPMDTGRTRSDGTGPQPWEAVPMDTAENTVRRALPPELAAALRDARVTLGLGVCEAARRIGIPHSHLSNLEHGTRCPSTAVAHDLQRVLNLEPAIAAHLHTVARPDAGRSWRPPGGARPVGRDPRVRSMDTGAR